MSTTLIQADRWLTLDTPLGADALVATEVRGMESLSRLFEFTVHALSLQQVIAPQDLLGKNVTFSMARPGGKRRTVNGIVTSFSAGAIARSGYRYYALIVSPALWLLNRTSDYKVFQDKTAVQIIEQVLGAADIKFEKKLQGKYETREYCLQFGETDLAFFERLMAEEGLFYYFTHEKGSHKLVIADNPTAYTDCLQSEVVYRQEQAETADSVYMLNAGASLTDAQWKLEDYDFEAPSSKVDAQKKSALQPAAGKKWEHYRYPGGATKVGELSRFATAAIDAVEAGFETIDGEGTCASFTPGHRFKLKQHPVGALENKQFVVTEVHHEAVDRSHFAMRAGTEVKPFYRNRFSSIPASRTARPAILPQKPLARGPQTALVVGPAGEEIHTDKYGRIRIQFHWDRYGKKDEKSSCFVRVAQGLAGNQWGSVFIPRIGMEVVVQFLDGDPDRPLVVGAVYNGNNMPPWSLPGDATKSGILTRSSKQGQVSTANELSFDDKRGSERILLHAEKDFQREVENDDILDVGHDQKRTIKNDRTTTIAEGNDTYTLTKGNRAETIETGNDELVISKGNRNVTIAQGNETLDVSKGNRTTTVDSGNDTLTLTSGNQTTKAAGGKITLEAAQGITLKCGSSTIEVTPQGVKVNGMTVTLQGTAKSEVKAPIVDVSGDGMVTVKGGLVKIN